MISITLADDVQPVNVETSEQTFSFWQRLSRFGVADQTLANDVQHAQVVKSSQTFSFWQYVSPFEWANYFITGGAIKSNFDRFVDWLQANETIASWKIKAEIIACFLTCLAGWALSLFLFGLFHLLLRALYVPRRVHHWVNISALCWISFPQGDELHYCLRIIFFFFALMVAMISKTIFCFNKDKELVMSGETIKHMPDQASLVVHCQILLPLVYGVFETLVIVYGVSYST